jgi:hypothetical protein
MKFDTLITNITESLKVKPGTISYNERNNLYKYVTDNKVIYSLDKEQTVKHNIYGPAVIYRWPSMASRQEYWIYGKQYPLSQWKIAAKKIRNLKELKGVMDL